MGILPKWREKSHVSEVLFVMQIPIFAENSQKSNPMEIYNIYIIYITDRLKDIDVFFNTMPNKSGIAGHYFQFEIGSFQGPCYLGVMLYTFVHTDLHSSVC